MFYGGFVTLTNRRSAPGIDEWTFMKATAIAIRHVPFEDLGVLGPVLTSRGYRIEYLDAGVDDLRPIIDADLVVVLGGPVGVYDTARYPFLREELRCIELRLAKLDPTLGICLGAQLIAAALGAAVHPTGGVEIGYGPISLTSTGQDSPLRALGDVPVLHWHGDQFDIPDGADDLAYSRNFTHQAFAVDHHVLGLQFHLEADHTHIERWLIGHAHELTSHQVDPAALRADAQQFGPQLAQRASQVFADWIDASNTVH